MGWHYCRALAARHDLTVLCSPGMAGAERNVFREEIESHLRRHGPVPGLAFRFVPHPFWSSLCQRESGLRRRTVYYSGYAAWQRAAYRAGAELHARQPFDLVHQLNMTGFREPGYLWKLPAPFVWGPVGGAADIPAAFFPLMGWRERAFYAARNAGNALQKRTARRAKRAAMRAAKIWAVGEENRRMVEGRWGRQADVLLDTGTTERPGVAPRTLDPRRPVRIVWSGLHIGRKALPVLLHALARLGDTPAVALTVLGGGPETANWKAAAARLGITPRVRWAGMLPHADAVAEMGRADVVAFTSVQEGTPHVVLEALSLGLPVVCHDACGMGVAVDETCGIKVPMESPHVSEVGFAAGIGALAADPAEYARLSAGALARAAALRWEALAGAVADGYDAVLAGRSAGTGGRV